MNNFATLYEWLENSQSFTHEHIHKKYGKFFDILPQLCEESFANPTTVMIVGGGDCKVESIILDKLALQEVNLVAIDFVQPKIQQRKPINSIKWISGEFNRNVLTENSIHADIIICLGSSRYFDDALETYTDMIETLNKGSIIIFDFYELPPLRGAVTDVLRKWLKAAWVEDSDNTKKQLEDLAELSIKMSEQLGSSSVNLEKGVNGLGIPSGTIKMQQLIYEAIFPLWYKPGATKPEVAAQLAWTSLVANHDNSLDKIQKFVSANNLSTKKIYELCKDTHVLIAKK